MQSPPKVSSNQFINTKKTLKLQGAVNKGLSVRSSIGYSFGPNSAKQGSNSRSRAGTTTNQSKERSPINSRQHKHNVQLLQNTWTYRYNRNGQQSTNSGGQKLQSNQKMRSGQNTSKNRSNSRNSRKSSMKRKRSVTPKSVNSHSRNKSKLPEKILNIKSEISSQNQTNNGGLNTVNIQENNTLNNTIDFFNELHMGSTIKQSRTKAGTNNDTGEVNMKEIYTNMPPSHGQQANFSPMAAAHLQRQSPETAVLLSNQSPETYHNIDMQPTRPDDFTLSLIDSAPKNMIQGSRRPGTDNMMAAGDMNDASGHTTLHLAHDHGTHDNSRNQSNRAPLSGADVNTDGLTGQVSASFPHSGTHGTNNQSQKSSERYAQQQKQQQQEMNYSQDPYANYQQMMMKPTQQMMHQEIAEEDDEGEEQQPSPEKQQQPSQRQNMHSVDLQPHYIQAQPTTDGSHLSQWPQERTRTHKLHQQYQFHQTADNQRNQYMNSNYNMANLPSTQESHHYMTSHRPAINYYMSSKSSNIGAGDFGVQSSSSQFKTNLQHVHSFPLTGMGTITTPTNQLNSQNHSSVITSNSFYPQQMTGMAGATPTLQKKSAQLLQQFRNAKQKGKKANASNGHHGTTRESTHLRNKSGQKHQRENSRSKSVERSFRSGSKTKKSMSKLRYGNFGNNLSRESRSKSRHHNQDLKSIQHKTVSYRNSSKTNQNSQMRSPAAKTKRSIDQHSRSKSRSTNSYAPKMNSKSKYKVSFRECDKAFKTSQGGVFGKKQLSGISNRRMTTFNIRKKSMDSYKSSGNRSASVGKMGSLGARSHSNKNQHSSIGRKSMTSVNSSAKGRRVMIKNPYNDTSSVNKSSMNKSSKKGGTKKSDRSTSISRHKKRNLRSSKNMSQMIENTNRGQSMESVHRRQKMSPDQLQFIENNAHLMQNMGMSLGQLDHCRTGDASATTYFQVPYMAQNSYTTDMGQIGGGVQTAGPPSSHFYYTRQDQRNLNNHSTIVNDCNQSNLMNNIDMMSNQHINTQPVNGIHRYSRSNLMGQVSRKSLKRKPSDSKSAISNKSRKSLKSHKSHKSYKSTKKSYKKLSFEDQNMKKHLKTSNSKLLVAGKDESRRHSHQNSQTIMARQQSVGTVSNKSGYSSRKPILLKKNHRLTRNSKSNLSLNSKSGGHQASKSMDAGGVSQEASIYIGDGADIISIRDRSRGKYKQKIAKLKKDNAIIKEQLRVTEKYARDIEFHFIEQVKGLVQGLGGNRNLPTLVQVDTEEGSLHKTSDSQTGSLIYKSQDMLQKWINQVTEKEVAALKDAKACKLNLAQLQVSHNFIQKENRMLQKKVDRLKSLKTVRLKYKQIKGNKKSKSIVFVGKKDMLEHDRISSKSGKHNGSTRSLTVKKKKNRKTSSNTDIFTLFPQSEYNPYHDVIAGPHAKRKSRSSKRDKYPPRSPAKMKTASASRAQVQSYLETCERLEEELENLKSTQNININILKDKNQKLIEEVIDLKQKLVNRDLTIENFKLRKYGEGEDDYEFILKQNQELEQGRDNFRARYLEEREARKELEQQVKRVSKECNAKIDIIRHSAKGDFLQEKLRKIRSPTESADDIRGMAERHRIHDSNSEENNCERSYVMDARTTGRKKSGRQGDEFSNDNINDREPYSYNRSTR